MGVVELIDVVRALAGMSRSEVVATGGAALGFLGGVVLAFAASDELRAHRLALEALQNETAALVKAQLDPVSPLVRITGTDKHIKAGVRMNDWLTRLGIGLLTLSLVATVGAFFVKDPPPPPAPQVVSPAAPGAKTGGHGGITARS